MKMQELYNFSFHYIVLVLLFLAVGFTTIGSCLICCIYCVRPGHTPSWYAFEATSGGHSCERYERAGRMETMEENLSISFFSLYAPISD